MNPAIKHLQRREADASVAWHRAAPLRVDMAEGRRIWKPITATIHHYFSTP